MNGEKLMWAIGNISDKYVMEFSNVVSHKQVFSIKRWLPAVACFLIVITCWFSVPTLLKNPSTNPIEKNPQSTIFDEGSESDAPLHFYLKGKTYIADSSMTIVTEVPEGYFYAGTITNVGDLFSKKDFEGNFSGAVYLSKNGETAYVEASCLEKVNGKAVLILCKIEK